MCAAKRAISTFYAYLNLPYCEHRQFKNVDQIKIEDDLIYRTIGDHNIHPRVEVQSSRSKEILGKDLSRWIRNRYSWFYDQIPFLVGNQAGL